MDLRLRKSATAGANVLEVSGEIDLHSAPTLRNELTHLGSEEKPQLIVDLSGVSFIDSTGIGVLVGGLKRARENGGKLVFCAPQSRVQRVFEITGLLTALPLFETRGQALREFSSAEISASAESAQGTNISPDKSPVISTVSTGEDA